MRIQPHLVVATQVVGKQSRVSRHSTWGKQPPGARHLLHALTLALA